MFVTVIAIKYALLASQRSHEHFLKLTGSLLFELHYKSSPFISSHYIVSYTPNGDRIVIFSLLLLLLLLLLKGKGKVFPYSLPSVGPGADPGVQAVSPQVT